MAVVVVLVLSELGFSKSLSLWLAVKVKVKVERTNQLIESRANLLARQLFLFRLILHSTCLLDFTQETFARRLYVKLNRSGSIELSSLLDLAHF